MCPKSGAHRSLCCAPNPPQQHKSLLQASRPQNEPTHEQELEIIIYSGDSPSFPCLTAPNAVTMSVVAFLHSFLLWRREKEVFVKVHSKLHKISHVAGAPFRT